MSLICTTMKNLANNTRAALVMGALVTLLAAGIWVAPIRAQAAPSNADKAVLLDVLSRNNSYANYWELILILNRAFANNLTSATPASTNTSTITTGTSGTIAASSPMLCNYAKQITSNLDIGASGSQVLALQKLLNAQAQSDSSYSPIVATGGGSYGNETTYFGSLTQSALSRWQQRNMTTTAYLQGSVDYNTRARFNAVYCSGTAASSDTPNEFQSGAGTRISPKLTFDETNVSSGTKVRFSWNLYGMGRKDCKLIRQYPNQQSSDSTMLPSGGADWSVQLIEVTTEFYLSCNYLNTTYESNHVTVVADGVSSDGGGTGTATASVQIAKLSGVTDPQTYSGKINFAAHYNADADDIILYYGPSRSSCTSLANKLPGTRSTSYSKHFSLEISSLSQTATYYYCAAAVKSDGTVVVTTPVYDFSVARFRQCINNGSGSTCTL